MNNTPRIIINNIFSVYAYNVSQLIRILRFIFVTKSIAQLVVALRVPTYYAERCSRVGTCHASFESRSFEVIAMSP